MAGRVVDYIPDGRYDLYGEIDRRADGIPVPIPRFPATYAVRGKRFYLREHMDRRNINIGLAGWVEPVGDGAQGWCVLAGGKLLGVIRDGYYWRVDGERFRLVEARR